MKVHFLFLTFLTYCLPRIFYRIEKNQPLSFFLENTNSELFASLNYLDNIEENSKEEDKKNYFDFLIIDDSLNVNCIIKNIADSEPNETLLNRYNKTSYCQYELELNNGKKLIPFPKNFTNEERIYFIFFLKEESQIPAEINRVFEVKRIPSPKYINNSLDFTLAQKETLIYFIQTRRYKNYVFFSKTKLKMPFYLYKPGRILDDNEYEPERFLAKGFVGEDSPIYSYSYLDFYDEIQYNIYLIIHNYKEEAQHIKLEYFEYSDEYKIRYKMVEADNYNLKTYYSYYSDYNKYWLFNIYNPNKLIIGFGKSYIDYEIYFFDYDIEEVENLNDLTNMKYYKELSTEYFYSQKNYSIILFLSIGCEWDGWGKLTLYLEYYFDNITSNLIEDHFNIFKITKNEEIIFNCSNPGNSIILKSLSSNKGNIQINDLIYNIKEENQILEINHGYLKEYKIKALNNDFAFGIKNQINKNLFVYPDIWKEYNLSLFNNETFLVYELDIINYDFISFSMKNFQQSEFFQSTRFFYKNNFGLLDENEIEKKKFINEYGMDDRDYNTWSYSFHTFKYYQNKKDLNRNKVLVAFYFKTSNWFNGIITAKYYKNLNFKENIYIKNFEKNVSLAYLLDKKNDFLLYFLGDTGIYGFYKGWMIGYEGRTFSDLHLVKIDSERDILTTLEFKFKFEGYVMKIPLNNLTANIHTNYYFSIGVKEVKILNNTHFKIIFVERYFSNVKKVNFYFILKNYDKNENYQSKVYLFENYYLENKTNTNNTEYEIYNFSNIFSSIISFICPISTKFNLSEYNREYVFIFIEETIPYKLVHIYDPFIYRTQNKTEEITESLITELIREETELIREETESIKENINEKENYSKGDWVNMKKSIFMIIYLLLFLLLC